MRSNGFLSLLRSASWWGRGLCLWLCIVLLLLPSVSYASEPNKQLLSIEYRLSRIIGYSDRLEEELKNSQKISEEQNKRIEQLLSELGQLKTRLEASRSLLEKYRHQVGELLDTIGQLEARLKQLSESYETSEISWTKALQTAEKEIQRQKSKTVLCVIVTAAAAGAMGYTIGRLKQ